MSMAGPYGCLGIRVNIKQGRGEVTLTAKHVYMAARVYEGRCINILV